MRCACRYGKASSASTAQASKRTGSPAPSQQGDSSPLLKPALSSTDLRVTVDAMMGAGGKRDMV